MATNGRGVVNWLLARREQLMGALLIGNNVANIAGSTLATGLFLAWFGDVGVALCAAVGDDRPGRGVLRGAAEDGGAFNAPDRIALLVARPMRAVVRFLGPVLNFTEWLVNRMLAGVGFQGRGDQADLVRHTRNCAAPADLLHQGGSVEKRDRDMLGGCSTCVS